MNPSPHFNRGWADRLKALPPRASYEKAKTLPRVQYERGRHVASLWLFWIEAKAAGTIHSARRVSFETAFKLMPDELKRAVYAEEAFCSLASELMVGVHL